MKQLQKFSKFLSDYTSIVVIAIAVITFFLPSLMGWVNFQLFTDPVANKFTSQSIIIGVILFSMGLTDVYKRQVVILFLNVRSSSYSSPLLLAIGVIVLCGSPLVCSKINASGSL